MRQCPTSFSAMETSANRWSWIYRFLRAPFYGQFDKQEYLLVSTGTKKTKTPDK